MRWRLWVAVLVFLVAGSGLPQLSASAQGFETINVAALSCPYGYPPEFGECFKPIVRYPYGSQTGYIHPQVARDMGVVPRANSLVKVMEDTSRACYLGSVSLSSAGSIELNVMKICGAGGTITLQAAKQITGSILCDQSYLTLGVYKVIASASVVNITGIGCGANLIINQAALSAIDPYNALARARNGSLAPVDLFNATGQFKNDIAKGVAADGAATLVLAFETQNQAGQVSFVIEGNAKGRLANYDPNFGKGYSAPNASVTPPIVAIRKSDGTDAYYSLALYKAPEMAEAFSQKGAVDVVAVTYNGQTYKLPIEIQAPPLLLAHGLWGHSSTWSGAWSQPSSYFPLALNAINYDGSADFASPATMKEWSGAMNRLLLEARQKGFATARVDVIGHSMGGLAARAFSQASLFDSENYGLGAYSLSRIYRTLTVNTPHRGSELADVLWQNRNQPVSKVAACSLTAGGVLAALSDSGQPVTTGQLLGFIVSLDRACLLPGNTLASVFSGLNQSISGAVQSLVPGSPSLAGTPGLDANSVMIGTQAAPDTTQEQFLDALLWLYTNAASASPRGPTHIIDSLLADDSDRHDVIVSVSSQKNRPAGLGSVDKVGPTHLEVTKDSELAAYSYCILARKTSCYVGANSPANIASAPAPPIDLRGYTHVAPIVNSISIQVSRDGDGKIQLGSQRVIQSSITSGNAYPLKAFGCFVENEGETTEYWLTDPVLLNSPRNCYFEVKRRGKVRIHLLEVGGNNTFTTYSGEWDTSANTDQNLARTLRLDPGAAFLKPNEQVQYSAVVHFPYSNYPEVEAANPVFSIDGGANPVASVTASGMVTAIREGVTNVTATAEGMTASAEIRVGPVPTDPPRLADGEILAAMLPASRSINRTATATAFATILNASTKADAIGCSIGTINNQDRAAFTFTATDPATNLTVGQQNQPTDIPRGEARTFVIALAPNQVIPTQTYEFAFSCENSELAPVFADLNTLQFTSAASDVPDVIALAGTLANDGIVTAIAPGQTGGGVFVVATSNIGEPAEIRVRPVMRIPRNDVTLLVCETDTSTGACLAPPGAVVDTIMKQRTTSSFSIFVLKEGGAVIPYDPARNRIVVQFEDLDSTPAGAVRGSTSVALR